MSRRTYSLRRILGAPAAIAAVSTVGLVTALVGDGLGDWVSWVTLAVPLLVVAWAWRRRG